MHFLVMETENFSFAATGRSRKEAVQALARGWDKHCAQYEISPTEPIETLMDHCGAWFITLPIGSCARDGEVIYHSRQGGTK